MATAAFVRRTTGFHPGHRDTKVNYCSQDMTKTLREILIQPALEEEEEEKKVVSIISRRGNKGKGSTVSN